MGDATIAYVAVGSNIDPRANIPAALEILARGVRILALSTFHRTEPMGPPGQPPFINGMCAVMTDMRARALKYDLLRPVEAEVGRVRTCDKYAPRPIDLDIALFGNLVVREPDLQIPDSHLRERPFMLVTLHELAPDTVLPDTNESLAGLVASLSQEGMSPDLDLTRRLKERLNLT